MQLGWQTGGGYMLRGFIGLRPTVGIVPDLDIGGGQEKLPIGRGSEMLDADGTGT